MEQEVLDLTTEEDIEAALEDARNCPPMPHAIAAEYDSRLHIVILRIDDGSRLVIPREELQGLENATPEQLADIKIFGGNDIAWPQLDVDHYIPYLLEGTYATEKWKAERRKPAVVVA